MNFRPIKDDNKVQESIQLLTAKADKDDIDGDCDIPPRSQVCEESRLWMKLIDCLDAFRFIVATGYVYAARGNPGMLCVRYDI